MRSLRRILLEHLWAVFVVGLVLVGVAALLIGSEKNSQHHPDGRIEGYLNIPSVDWSDPLHKELFRDSYRALHPETDQNVDSVLRRIEDVRIAHLTDPLLKQGGGPKSLTLESGLDLVQMYAVFLLVFVTVLAVTYGAARAMAVWKFVAAKQGRSSYLHRYFMAAKTHGVRGAVLRVDLLAKSVLHGAASFVLFSPAYVIAYSLRTRLDTENVLFIVVLAIVSNGVLVHYANRLYTLLMAESRKGYVETALVKGVPGKFAWNEQGGLARRVLFFPAKASNGHLFREVYRNARLQFIPSMKEHVAFMVTGLVIIEMALNIKGHLCYALLQHILYREYDLAIAIVFLIFVAVKAVEGCIDVWHAFELRKYDNAG